MTTSIIGGSFDNLFIAIKHVCCRDKSMLAATKRLSRQNICIYRDIYLYVYRNVFVCLSRHNIYLCLSRYIFVATSILLSRQKTFFCVCRDKNDTCGSSRLDFHTAPELCRVESSSSSVLFHVHRDRKDNQGRGAQDGHLDLHTAPQLCEARLPSIYYGSSVSQLEMAWTHRNTLT